jgi:uncharacterized protein YbjT (DUF2867 family)
MSTLLFRWEHKKMRKILVTAASGNAGRSAVNALLSSGFSVVATSRNPQSLACPPGVEARQYDANADVDFDVLLKDIDDVVLIGPPLDGQVHEKLAPFIKAASARNIGRLVYLSGNYLAGFSGTSLANLAIRKVELEVINSGLPYTLVRAGFFMDNFLTGFYKPMVDQGSIRLAVGDAKSAFVAASDVGEFIAQAILQDLSGEYIVTGPEALDHQHVASLLSRKLSKPVSYDSITEEQLRQVYISKGLAPQTIEYGLTLYRAVRNQATAAITDSFKQATGREPKTFEAFLGLT